MARPVVYKTIDEKIEARRRNEERRRLKDPLKYKEYNKKWREKNKEYLKNKIKEYYTSHQEERIKYNIEYQKNREQIDPIYKMSRHLRKIIFNSFKRNKSGSFRKSSKTEEILGCSLEFFISYLLNKCPEGTMINDFGEKGYHIDHIIPLSSANTQEEVTKLCHYTNLQPLWWKDNLLKSNKTN